MEVEPLEFKVIRKPGGEREILFIHGYGGNIEQPGVKWVMNRLSGHGHSVTYIQLPTVISSFRKDIVEPVSKVHEKMGDHVTIGFSIGGLASAYLEGSRGTIYMSPFWGINDRWTFRGLGSLLKVLAGINAPDLKRHFEKEDAGPLAVDDDMLGIPDVVGPRTIHEMHHAQLHMPRPDPNDVVFYCPQDKVVSVSKIEKQKIRKHTFNGGHMFYLSREREQIMDRIMSIVDGAFD